MFFLLLLLLNSDFGGLLLEEECRFTESLSLREDDFSFLWVVEEEEEEDPVGSGAAPDCKDKQNDKGFNCFL